MKRCHYCGKELPAGKVTTDHKVPISRGGTDAPENKVPACISCNSAKGPMTEEEFRRYGPHGGKWPILRDRIIERSYSSQMHTKLALEMARKTGSEEDLRFLRRAMQKMKTA
jgi:5-methylcytosine-specific restriction endonuclease McrA